ncbi:MAG: ABC transporter ATP-binding protein, partial [Clostridia bacterium]|nr:ABC transporter ATP-binding protein [Clostridia bacterium]
MDTILSIEHVSNYYYDNGLGIFARRKKKQVLHDVSLTIGKDEFFGLVGESGCGKTTLGNCILGNIPFEGRITLGGMERKDADRLTFARMVQSVYQDPSSALNPRRTVGQTMMEPLLAHGIGTPESRSSAVDRMLYRIGLDPTYKNRKPSELSGGQRQRVCIGAALMLEPELIIADEAVSALDVSVGSQILNLFLEIDVEKDFSML